MARNFLQWISPGSSNEPNHVRAPSHGGPNDRLADSHVHSVWVGHVVSFVPEFDVVYTNSPLVIRLFREKGFKVEELPLLKRDAYSGRLIRKLIFEGSGWAPLVPKAVASYILDCDGHRRIRETLRYSTPYGTRENDA